MAALLLLGNLILTATPPSGPQLHGFLYFASGSHLGQFNLGDGSSGVAAGFGNVNIQHVSALDDERLLLSISGPINERMVNRIVRFDPDTGETRPLFSGRSARYLPGAGFIVFERGSRLLATGTGNNPSGETVVRSYERGASFKFMTLSQNRLLFAEQAGQDTDLTLRNLVTGEESLLEGLSGQCDVDAAIWLAHSEQLLCPDVNSRAQVFRYVTLEGNVAGELTIPDTVAPRVVTYLADQDALIFTDMRASWIGGRERTSVWVYDLSAEAFYRLAKNQYLGTSVAYRR